MNGSVVAPAPDGSEAPSARPAILEVEGLRVTFATTLGSVEAVRDLSFSIAAGQILAVVGESGSGKSVTARTLVGLAGSRAEVTAKTMRLIGHGGRNIDLNRLAEPVWRTIRGREIGFVLQDALVSLDPLRTIGREIAEPILTHGLLPRSLVSTEVATLLSRVGVPEPEVRVGQYPHELSGGLRQRALIASGLAGRPRLLIADEPTTALDVTVQQQILAVFAELAQAGHGVLLITHDLAVAAQIADRIVVMQRGEAVESGTTKQVLSTPRHVYTRRLLAAVPSVATRGRPLSSASSVEPQSTPMGDQPKILEMREISVRFQRRDGSTLRAVTGVSLDIRQGETLGLVGGSGSGKTTLGKVALALQTPDRGDVLFRGRPWSTLSEACRRPFRRRIQTIVQDPLSSFDPRYTVARLIEQPLKLHANLDEASRSSRATELLASVGLPGDFLARRPHTLSGGQRQRVSIAQALACEPELLICDEPVSALDVTTQAQILDLLVALQHRLGLAMLFISHDLSVVQHMSHRIAVMNEGEIVEVGTVEEIFSTPRHAYTRGLLAAMPGLRWDKNAERNDPA